MSRIFVAGMGAVSPAGWTVAALREALDQDEPLPVQTLERPGWEKPLPARLVPNPTSRPEFLTHPRLRRTSPITHYVVAAALEATAGLRADRDPGFRLGLVVCLQSGCVNYSCRFYEETLKDPATASPLLFPETVYAAPASHLAAVLGNISLANSLVGDPATFLQGVSLGAQWLEENRVDACLVIGAEETNWILADALWHLERPAVLTAGAGALCLCREPELSVGVELAAITDAHTYSTQNSRTQAARAMRAQLGKKLLPVRIALRRRREQPAHGCSRTRGLARLDRPAPQPEADSGRRLDGRRRLAMRRRVRCGGRRTIRCRQCQSGRFQSAGDGRAVCARRFRHFSFVHRRIAGQHSAMSLRVILITGANGGLGQAIARAFLQESPDNVVWLGVRSRREHADKLAQENPEPLFLRHPGCHRS